MGECELKECKQDCESKRRVIELENVTKNLNEKIGGIEQKVIALSEQSKMIFILLEDLKENLKSLRKDVAELEKGPRDTTRNIVMGVVTAVVTAIIMMGLKLIN